MVRRWSQGSWIVTKERPWQQPLISYQLVQISWERAQSLLVDFGWEIDDFQVVRGSPKATPSAR
ncbi:hypothetical protein C2845_PM05G26240 [Panicum miliaceum]|uniref:Uncharacterized protein n=1 Tax=Panicum miliaceum TaxID=4540 RepID=A0A3L6T520_PANMI|nr:hypothetical protein C2845_PM05G26240 [Panicum miliaceum]